MFNTTNVTYLTVCLLISMMLMAVNGCNIKDLVKVNTPAGIAADQGLPSKMSLSEAEVSFRLWSTEQKAYASQWKNSIEDGNFFVNTLDQITMKALDTIGPAVGGIPMFGPLLPLLAGGIGVFMKRPGDTNKKAMEQKFAAELRKEKQDSYNAGQKKPIATT